MMSELDTIVANLRVLARTGRAEMRRTLELAADELERLQAALRPFAVVTLPDNWPGNCVLAWRDRAEEWGQTLHGAFATYLHHKAQGGPTIADYRRATEALADSKAAEAAKGGEGDGRE